MRNFLFTCFLVLSFQVTQALPDVPKYKWGKVYPAEFAVKDSAGKAPAIILFDIGSQDFLVVHGEYVQVYDHHRRVKILNKGGFDMADVRITYETRNTREHVEGVEAICYWLNQKGEVESAEMDKNLIFDENIDDIHHIRKFTVPSVKEGCIIEFRYRIVSNYIFRLRNWYFQSTVPTKYSEMTNNIPQFLQFQDVDRGMFAISRGEVTNFTRSDHIHTVNSAHDVLTGQNPTEDFNLTVLFNERRFFAKDVPALEEEPFISSLENYEASTSFYLTGVNFPSGYRREYSSTWKYLVEQLYKDDYFGGRIAGDNSVADISRSLTAAIPDTAKKISAIYNYVKSSVVWTGVNEFYAGKRLKKVLEDHKGTSGEINLLLLQMLLASGIDAAPVLVSTRDNGILLQEFPSLYQFNDVLVAATVAGGRVLLDATDPFRASGNLDVNLLNGSGLLAKQNCFEWITLSNKDKNRSVLVANCKLAEDGLLEVSYDMTDNGYKACSERKKISSFGSTADYANKKLSSSIADVSLLESSFENVDSLNVQLKSHLKYSTHQFSNTLDSSLYLLPLADLGLKENPFTKDTRKLPVEFPGVTESSYYINIKLPEGYYVRELPKSEMIKLPENAAMYSFQVSNEAGLVQIKCALNINATYFDADAYYDLKAFYDKVMEKQKERIVLAKK